MILLRMTATFGRLENETLTLEPGLNLLELPNEGGKSTWCAFLRAMLYGLEGRKGGALSERNRCLPWSGSPMSGVIDLLWQGKAVTLRRYPKGSNPFGGFQAVYTGTEEPVPGLTADGAGETLLGMTKEVFQRTCFISQGGLQVDPSGDLERRIAALASAGEEDVSFSDAEGRLRDWRNARQSNKSTGSLPKLRAQLADLQAQRQRLLEARRRGAEAQSALTRLAGELRETEADLARHARLEEAEKLAGRRARYEDAARRLAQAEDALAAAQAQSDQALAACPPKPKQNLPIWLMLILWAVILAVFLPVGWIIGPAGLATAGVLISLAWIVAILSLARRREARSLAYDRGFAAWQRARELLQAAQSDYAAAQAVWETLSAQGEPPAPPEVSDLPRQDLARDQADLKRLRQSIALYQDQLARSRGEEEALGGASPLAERIAALEEAVAREEGELAALNLALEALTAANAQLQTRFSPALNAKAGALLSQLTGGRYSAVSFTREFQALAQAEGDFKSAQLLSQGTADQTYLALRLAICLLALPQGPEAAPLVLDDALVTFDDTRLKLALDLLGGLARERQVLLFTCQSRERSALAACNFTQEPL